jgi:hypothetical protein
MSASEFPEPDYIKDVCRIGQSHACCRYLTMGPGGWCCEKNTGLSAVLDARVALGSMVARGDNCEGQPEPGSRGTSINGH